MLKGPTGTSCYRPIPPGPPRLDVNRTLQSAGSSSGSSSSKSRRAQSNSAYSLSPDLGVLRPSSNERADVSFKNRFRGMAKSSSADLTIPDENDLIPCRSGIREGPEQAGKLKTSKDRRVAPNGPSIAFSSSTLAGDYWTSALGAYLPAVSNSGTSAYRRPSRARSAEPT